ncbi:serine/threonine protein kinase [Streptomyces griseochromogenes]|uniref:non-specific serine/threonine protein kinase n=1 Tax=Streptomyces griseochromogenes TaxID=68214 RepID=A0A1B1BBN1_9ACTN|nr:serine/threonine-protein kinase [Streptomyces griseochromogenes]ANP56246.1 serine/threonine protein phosphatase [Streptomyces griseochromogenes]MBP2052790.1 serine/threonine protein kinase [Streptomyces griseochromogenes]
MSDLGRLVAGRYLLVERVGSGGMGTVWRAEDKLLGRHVAVKKLHIPPHLHDDEVHRLYERTRREARSAARITHPNVIVVHDVVDDEGLPCIVMEYIPSVTLSDVLKRQGALAPEEAARIGRATAAALRAAHEAGVLHRDVKPANVLLGDGGRIVLTDFGIAMESGTSSLTKSGELIGSIRYLAPERLRSGHREPGPASDLWSLGATLYQAVEGRHPFHRDTPIETAYAIATDSYEPLRNAGDLAPVIEGLLVKEPEQRMDVHEVERLLGEVTGTRTAPVDPPTLSDRAVDRTPSGRKGGGRRRTVMRSVLAVALAAGVAGGALWWLRDRADAPHTHRADASSASSPSTGPSGSTVPPLPDGYHLAKADTGISVPVQDGWTRKTLAGGEVGYIDPSGKVGLRVNVVQFAGTDPLQHWRETEEDQTRRKNPNYERVRMAATTFRGRPAGYWEFTFDGRARKYRGAELAFAGADGTQYVIYLSAPDAQWHTYRPVFDTAVNGARLSGDER